MRWITLLILLLCVACYLSGCDPTDANGDTDPGPDPDPPPQVQTFTLTAEASPAEAGSVDPSSETYDEGDEITVEASANEGWAFESWSGDIESEENPLVFTISQDTELTAHFADISSVYRVDVSLSDGSVELDELGFGQEENPQSVSAPPPPPEGAHHAWFLYEGEELFMDYRSHTQTDLTWELYYQAEAGQPLTLAWLVEVTQMEGSLTLTDLDASFEVDMLHETAFEFAASEYAYFQIIYQLNDE